MVANLFSTMRSHRARSARLSDLADKAPAPATVAIMAVRRASLGRLHLVGPSKATELESVTGIFVASTSRVSKEARRVHWQHCVCAERHVARGTVGGTAFEQAKTSRQIKNRL